MGFLEAINNWIIGPPSSWPEGCKVTVLSPYGNESGELISCTGSMAVVKLSHSRSVMLPSNRLKRE